MCWCLPVYCSSADTKPRYSHQTSLVNTTNWRRLNLFRVVDMFDSDSVIQRSLFGTCKPSSKIQDVPNRETRDFDFQPTSHKVAKRLNSPHNEVQKMMTFLLFFDNAIYVISFQIWLDLRNEECWQRPAIEFSEQRRWSIVSLIQLHSEKKVLSPVWTRTSREGCKSSFYCY